MRSRLEGSLSTALGHKVEIGNVSVKILPPGFDLSRFTILDDPRFSSEPILRADAVSATIHPSSLWHRRVEIASLSFKEASLNLVRLPNGTWNVEPILERAVQTPTAPTASSQPGTRPRFPYIEVTDGRVNLKLGLEKTPLALTSADLALWLQSDDEWGFRLKGQPVRTDMRLSDAGLLSMNGSWRRAQNLRKTPLAVTARFDGAQLGQLTKFIYGSDKGWRGTLRSSANFKGTVEDLQVQAEASVDDFRRYDIVASQSLRLAAQCAANYSSASHQLAEIQCNSPVGTGNLQVSGRFAFANPPVYDLTATAAQFPADALASVARRLKQNLPEDLSATGTVNANLSFRRRLASDPVWSGNGAGNGLVLHSALLRTVEGDDSLELGTVPFHAGPETGGASGSDPHVEHSQDFVKHNSPKLMVAHRNAPTQPLQGNFLEVGPFTVTLGDQQTSDFHAWFSTQGYVANFSGDAPAQRLLQIGRLAGVTAIHPAIEGAAKFAWNARGDWRGFAAPQTSGTIHLSTARVEFPGLNAPVEIAAADVALSPDTVKLDKLSATTGGVHWTGTILRPRLCPGPVPCPTTVDLRADELSTDQVNVLLNPTIVKRPWYRILTGGGQAGSLLQKLNVTGTLKVGHFVARDFSASAVSAQIGLANGLFQASNVRGTLFGGHHVGEWMADFTQAAPVYSGSGACDGVSLTQFGKFARVSWLTGTASAKYDLALSGWDAAVLQSSAHGKFEIDAEDGSLARFDPSTPAAPLRFRRLQVNLSLGNSLLALSGGKLQSPRGIYTLSGVTSLNRKLDLKLQRDDIPDAKRTGIAVTGTLDSPHVEPLAPPLP